MEEEERIAREKRLLEESERDALQASEDAKLAKSRFSELAFA